MTPPTRAEGRDELFECFDAAHRRLVVALSETTDDVGVWTWAASARHVGFVRRRQAHEALIHRVDAELTAGRISDVDVLLATDGVAEALEHMFGGSPPWASHREPGPVGSLSTTDSDVTWLLRLGRWSGTSPTTGTLYADEGMIELIASGTPTFGISGRAGDLDLWMWGRPTDGPIERRGDVTEFEAIISPGIQ